MGSLQGRGPPERGPDASPPCQRGASSWHTGAFTLRNMKPLIYSFRGPSGSASEEEANHYLSHGKQLSISPSCHARATTHSPPRRQAGCKQPPGYCVSFLLAGKNPPPWWEID